MINKKRILHVDDEEDTLSVVKTILENEGFEVISVRNGVSALEQVNLDGFDLIILDIMMPEMSGWKLFSKIGKVRENCKVIFLSVVDLSVEKINELKEAGVGDYIRKPFILNNLVNRVKKVIAYV